MLHLFTVGGCLLLSTVLFIGCCLLICMVVKLLFTVFKTNVFWQYLLLNAIISLGLGQRTVTKFVLVAKF